MLDTSDLDRWIGVPLTGGDIVEDIHVNDIRRWAQAMHNPFPLYYDRAWASESRFGDIVAPLSFTVNTTWGHGAEPSIQGVVPGTHMLFGGDEWWFFGPRIRPGDVIRCDRMFFDYDQKETKFAGPTIFSRGDTTYVNQRGEIVAKQRSTSIRYLAEEAAKRVAEEEMVDPVWSDEDIARIEEEKMDYLQVLPRCRSRATNDGEGRRESAAPTDRAPHGAVLHDRMARLPLPGLGGHELRLPRDRVDHREGGLAARDDQGLRGGQIDPAPRTGSTWARRAATRSRATHRWWGCREAMATASRWGPGSSTT